MDLQGKTATVFGGTGFIGRYVVDKLAREGATVKIASRHPSSGYFLRQFGTVGQIVPYFCDYSDAGIDKAVDGSDIVVNCLGILFEKGSSTFEKVHVGYAGQIAAACRRHGVSRLVHISALGIDQAKSEYARTKREGEAKLRAAYPEATILRPSVVFGPEDKFFNKFATLSMFMPALPLIAGGHTKFQPVYAGDVAAAVMKAVTLPAFGEASPAGKTFELGGQETVTFRDIYQKLFAQTGRSRFMFALPETLARMQAAVLSLLPAPPLTNDQITSLQTDNIIGPQALTLADLGITPTAMEAILPKYLDRYRPGGRFAEKKRA